MSERLLKRQGVYYYRRRSPSDLLKVLGRPVIQKSLRTGSLSDAKRLRTVEDARWDAEFDRLREEVGRGAPTPAPVATSTVAVVRAYVSSQYSASEAQFYSGPTTDEQLRDMQGEAASLLSKLANSQTGDADEVIARSAEKMLPASLTDNAEAAVIVQRGLVELFRHRAALFGGSAKRSFYDPMFDPETNEISFREVAEQYRRNRADDAASNELRPKTADKTNARIDLIIELVGDCSVQSLGYDKCMEVRELLAKLPANRNKLFPGVSVSHAIARAAQEGRKTLSSITQGDYLRTLQSILDLALKKQLISSNPAEGLAPLKRDTASPEDQRQPFTLKQIATFFSSSFYRSFADGGLPIRSPTVTGDIGCP